MAKTICFQKENKAARSGKGMVKRLFDLILSLLSLPFSLPLGALIFIGIYAVSPGKVVFAHQRVGQGGEKFMCYKFRTMLPDAEELLTEYLQKNPLAKAEWEANYKLKDDPRVTLIGRYLRKTSLDELPQLWNVLKGEMSLVGPRPIVEEEIARYGEYIKEYYLVPPGITGIWQVSGRSDTTYEERVAMDTWYARNWSVSLDFLLLLKTIKFVIMGKGAY